jgi:hypothetical protein
MWMFTRYGFFSVTRPTMGSGDLPPAALLQVRARVRSHLEALRARFPTLADCPLLTTSNSDYRYRLIVERNAWAKVASQLALDTNYRNFKAECGRAGPWIGEEYKEALPRIWGIHHSLQTTAPDTQSSKLLPAPFMGWRAAARRVHENPQVLAALMPEVDGAPGGASETALLAFCGQEPAGWTELEEDQRAKLARGVIGLLSASDRLSFLADVFSKLWEDNRSSLDGRTAELLPMVAVVMRKRGASLPRFAPADVHTKYEQLLACDTPSNPEWWKRALDALRRSALHFDALIDGFHAAIAGPFQQNWNAVSPNVDDLRAHAVRDAVAFMNSVSEGSRPLLDSCALLSMLRSRLEQGLSTWAFRTYGIELPPDQCVGTETAQRFMLESEIFPAVVHDAADKFRLPLGAQGLMKNGNTWSVAGYGITTSGEAVYVVQDQDGVHHIVECAKIERRKLHPLWPGNSSGSRQPWPALKSKKTMVESWRPLNSLNLEMLPLLRPRLQAYPYPSD